MARSGPPAGAPALPSRARKQSPYERLKEAILTGELTPGQQLVETALAQWCEVSRTPIREALLRLEHDGLISRTDRGLVVRERSPEEILDIYETRIGLEATAARMAAIRRSQLDIVQLRRLSASLRDVDTSEEAAMAASNREFHQAVWRASRNQSLIDTLTLLNLHLARYPATTLSQPGRWDEANAEHEEIVDALERQDAAAAAELATKHFTRARDLRLGLWAQHRA
jgi:DNA-binding GntR family transcriptional regulator